jgi:COP9 signalosome complex subunit 3
MLSDPPPQFSKADIDDVLRKAQEQSALLVKLDMEASRSREFLFKVFISHSIL